MMSSSLIWGKVSFMKRRVPLIFAFGSALAMAACTWVQPDPGAEQVRLLRSDQTAQCERLAYTTVSVRDRVAAVQRSPGKVEEELETLARNSAIDINGDAIAPAGPVQDGRRRYAIYHCGFHD
jgi:hypothetical protein